MLIQTIFVSLFTLLSWIITSSSITLILYTSNHHKQNLNFITIIILTSTVILDILTLMTVMRDYQLSFAFHICTITATLPLIILILVMMKYWQEFTVKNNNK